MDDKLTAKTVKFTSLENLHAYGSAKRGILIYEAMNLSITYAHQNMRRYFCEIIVFLFSEDCFIHRSRLFYDQNHKEIFPSSGTNLYGSLYMELYSIPVGHILSHVSARGANKLI